MTLQLADRSNRHLRGIIGNVVVKVDKFIFPLDFFILDVDEDLEVPLILGRPFFATLQALIDVINGKITIRVSDEEVVFALSDLMKHSIDFDASCFYLDLTDLIVDDFV